MLLRLCWMSLDQNCHRTGWLPLLCFHLGSTAFWRKSTVHSSKLTWKWRAAPYKTTILYIGPLISFHFNLGEGISAVSREPCPSGPARRASASLKGHIDTRGLDCVAKVQDNGDTRKQKASRIHIFRYHVFYTI